ncbi:hypothetical protein BOTBODRAFT_402657 [Botryobasidium botryosum FD-172 SS1]|uniref:Uncharacterized protein n=1 Tax=Botryobasidium botryosum (strain FD-172 SS1) TaxID=930990 RepID=A0A067MC07_BOTB1|nr:hypothetical protein BOTBODRAFT_402657 [Botryobasidium botryosum FD-172 SS1]
MTRPPQPASALHTRWTLLETVAGCGWRRWTLACALAAGAEKLSAGSGWLVSLYVGGRNGSTQADQASTPNASGVGCSTLCKHACTPDLTRASLSSRNSIVWPIGPSHAKHRAEPYSQCERALQLAT